MSAEGLVWIVRAVLLAGLVWGGWLCISHALLPPRTQNSAGFEYFATFALLVLLLTTVGGFLHGG
ncbi:MAG: hypothetical protein ACREUS_03685 [Burkholderiales bacterium]